MDVAVRRRPPGRQRQFPLAEKRPGKHPGRAEVQEGRPRRNACADVDRSRIPRWSLPGFFICRGKQCRNFRSGLPAFLRASGQFSGRSETVQGYICTDAQKKPSLEKMPIGRKGIRSDPETGSLTGSLEGRDTEVQGERNEARQELKDLAESRHLGCDFTRDLHTNVPGDQMGGRK